jgi:hypothetical protein
MGVFNDTLKEYGLGSGEKFKVKEGKNAIRILSEPRMVQSNFQGQINTKFVAWVLDRADGKIKLYYMPKTILEAVSAYEDDEQFGFPGLPMPYDITINAKNAGTKEVAYTVMPGKAVALTVAELEEFKSKKPIDEVVQRLMETQANVTEVQTSEGSHIKEHEDVPMPQEPRYSNIPSQFRPQIPPQAGGNGYPGGGGGNGY